MMKQLLARIFTKRFFRFAELRKNQKPSFLPCLEILECRIVPRTFIWDPAQGQSGWENPGNWDPVEPNPHHGPFGAATPVFAGRFRRPDSLGDPWPDFPVKERRKNH